VTARGASFADLLAESYAKLTGELLVPGGMSGDAAAAWLYEAPFGVLTHDTSPDPLFTYANRAAQQLFGYSRDEFVGLPSRLSAAAGQARDERQLFMDMVQRQGYADNYRGVRVTKSGRRFWIQDATVWNLIDAESVPVGQAALIRNWTFAWGRGS
jgi:PAS domain S-box-containing protein